MPGARVAVTDAQDRSSQKETPPPVVEAWGRSRYFAEDHGDRLGHPYIDLSSGTLIITGVDEEALNLARDAMKNGRIPAAPVEYRVVKHSFNKLEDVQRRISDAIQAGTFPDHDKWGGMSVDADHNRVLLDIREGFSDDLLTTLAETYGSDAVAVRVVQPPRAGDEGIRLLLP